jgi:hypothetical protein
MCSPACRPTSTTQSSSDDVAIALLSSPGLGRSTATANRCRFRCVAKASSRSIRRNWRARLRCESSCRRSREKWPNLTEQVANKENGAAKLATKVWHSIASKCRKSRGGRRWPRAAAYRESLRRSRVTSPRRGCWRKAVGYFRLSNTTSNSGLQGFGDIRKPKRFYPATRAP